MTATDTAAPGSAEPGTAAPGTAEPGTVHARATVRPDKAAAVAQIADAFRQASAAVLTEYRGLSVKQITALRVVLGADTSYSVVKNTLTRLAAADAGLPGLEEFLQGPTAVAFVNGDPVEAARGLRDYARSNPQLVVKGGVLDGKPMTADEIRRLADLESREVLLGKLAGAMLASLSQAVYLLNAPLAQVARLAAALQAKAEEDPSIIGGPGSAVDSADANGTDAASTNGDSTDAASPDAAGPDATSTDAAGLSDAAPDATAGPASDPAPDEAAGAAAAPTGGDSAAVEVSDAAAPTVAVGSATSETAPQPDADGSQTSEASTHPE